MFIHKVHTRITVVILESWHFWFGVGARHAGRKETQEGLR